MPSAPVPAFQLYGEDAAASDAGFVHIEPIESRSRPSAWRIRPHRHHSLDQLLLVRDGLVAVTIEGERQVLEGFTAIHIPAGAVHGFEFGDDVDGVVISYSPDLRTALAPGEAAMLPRRAFVQQLTPSHAGSLWALVACLEEEYARSSPSLTVAAGWLVGVLLVHLGRLVLDGGSQPADDDRAQRFRSLVDAHFHEQRPTAFYAAAIGMTVRHLTRFTAERFGCAPARYVHRRLLLEARRLLVYTSQPMTDVAEALGFDDPSYFSRFYLRMTGERPTVTRARAQARG